MFKTHTHTNTHIFGTPQRKENCSLSFSYVITSQEKKHPQVESRGRSSKSLEYVCHSFLWVYPFQNTPHSFANQKVKRTLANQVKILRSANLIAAEKNMYNKKLTPHTLKKKHQQNSQYTNVTQAQHQKRPVKL